MTSVTGASGGRRHGGEHDGAEGVCRWCGDPSAWTWSLSGEAGTQGDGRTVPEDCPVCTTCQSLTLAGDDAGLLDRLMTRLTARVRYPVAVDFLRDQQAARMARWINRRTTCRPVGPGVVDAAEACDRHAPATPGARGAVR